MKFSLLRNICTAAALYSAAVLLSSCANDDYDLRNGIDTTVGIDGNISLPVGSTGNIAIQDFLQISDESFVQADPVSGDYSIRIDNSDPIAESISLDRISIGPEDLFQDGGIDLNINVYSRIKNEYGQSLPDNTPVSDLQIIDMKAFDESDATVPIEIDEDVSQMADVLKAIGTVDLDATAAIDFVMSEGALTYKSGFSIVFPEYMKISVDAGDPYAEVRDGHILYFKQDLNITADAPVSVDVNIGQIDIKSLQEDTNGQQGLVDGRIFVNQEIALSDVYVDIFASDFGSVLGDMPENLTVSVNMNVNNAEVIGATLVIDPDMKIDDQRFEFGELPEFLTEEGNVLDLYNPSIMLTVGNTSPFAALVCAELNGVDESGAPLLAEPVRIGSADKDSPDAILVEPGNTMIFISTRGVDLSEVSQPEGYNPSINVIAEDLSLLLKNIPNELELKNVQVIIPHEGTQEDGYADSDYVKIEYPQGSAGLVYEFSLDYEVNIPLSFGEEFSMSYPFDISGISGSLGNSDGNNDGGDTSGDAENGNGTSGGSTWDVEIGKLEINFTFVNALPLALSIDAVPIDAEGNEIPQSSGLQIAIATGDGGPATVAAGNIGKEGSTRLSITGHVDSESIKALDGFRLDISASVPAEYAGVCLNSGQYFRIEDMSASIQGSGTIQINM